MAWAILPFMDTIAKYLSSKGMLYLSKFSSNIGAINENFSRELLELFTMGEGNYTQQDVMEGARGLTGYQTDGLNTYFNPNRFDDGVKTFLGQTGNFDTYDIINIMIIKYDSYSSSDGPKIFDNKYSYSSDSKKPTYNNAKKPNNVIKI